MVWTPSYMYQKCGFSCPHLGLTPFIWGEGAEVMTEQGLPPWPPGSVDEVMELRPAWGLLSAFWSLWKQGAYCPLVLLLQVCSLVLAALWLVRPVCVQGICLSRGQLILRWGHTCSGREFQSLDNLGKDPVCQLSAYIPESISDPPDSHPRQQDVCCREVVGLVGQAQRVPRVTGCPAPWSCSGPGLLPFFSSSCCTHSGAMEAVSWQTLVRDARAEFPTP